MALRTKERTQESAKSLTRAKAVHTGAANTPAIPLDIASLLGPYRKHGRLAFRIEQMPQTSRMSRGRNNGDRSWSIAEHELQELSYHPPEGAVDDHALMVRVVGLDQDGATLAVLSIPISIEVMQPTHSPSITPIQLASAANDTDRDGAIAASEKRAAERLENARAEWQREADEHLARAQAALKIEHASELSAVESRWKEEFAQLKNDVAASAKSTEAPRATRESSPQPDPKVLERLRGALASLTEDLATRDAALADANARIAKQDAERESLRSELASAQSESAAKPNADALEQLQQKLESAETDLANRDADLAGALAQIARQQTEFAQLRAELTRTQADAATKPNSSELQKLQAALRSAESALTSRDSDLTDTREQLAKEKAALEKLRAELANAQSEAASKPDPSDMQKLEASLKSAESDLASRDADLADALAKIARHETDAAQLRAELTSAKTAAAAKPDASELERVQATLASTQSDLANRDKAIAEANARIAKQINEGEKLRSELAAAAAAIAAKDATLKENTDRLRSELTSAQAAGATKESALAEQSERLRGELAAAQATSATKESALVEQSERLRAELKTAQDKISGHDSTVADLRQNLVLSEERWQKNSGDAFAKAKAESDKANASRIAAAEAEARSAKAQCRDLEAQLRASEAVLGDIRRRNAQSENPPHDNSDTDDLRAQLCALQVQFAERESELAKMHGTRGENRHVVDDDRIVLRTNRVIGGGTDEMPNTKKAREFAVSMVVFAIVTILGILYMPRLESLLPAEWQYDIDSGIADMRSSLGMEAPVAVAAAPPAAAAHTVIVPQATVVRTAKIHAGPKTAEAVTATLQRDSKVDVLDHNGNWTKVRSTNKNGEPIEGWVFSSFLQAAADDKASAK